MIDRMTSPPADSLIERVPPHHLEAEVAVLASILLDGETMGNIVPILNPADFYRSTHGRVYEIMQALYERGDPVDVLLVRRECEREGVLTEVGDDFLARLAGAVRSPAHAEHYAHIAEMPFFPSVRGFMQESPVVALALEGDDVISRVRDLLGPTDSKEAAAGTIRGDFGDKGSDSKMRNICHASDGPEAAADEIKRFFSEGEIA